ncbi:hypothetical protein Mapa_000569 [Marchantia paleacea]|nr:hypothetical protein Mapa_000569 [Marchantia paleacea]
MLLLEQLQLGTSNLDVGPISIRSNYEPSLEHLPPHPSKLELLLWQHEHVPGGAIKSCSHAYNLLLWQAPSRPIFIQVISLRKINEKCCSSRSYNTWLSRNID